MNVVEYAWLAGVTGLFVAVVLWGVWRAGEWLVQRERAWTDALGVVMAATVVRRDREQTLSVILEKVVEVTAACSGTLHMVRDGGSAYRLVHAVNVERLDWLADLPMNDPLAQQLSKTAAPFRLENRPVNARWSALTDGREGSTLLGMRLGRQALLVLAWRRPQAAERHLAALQAIQRYGEQVLGEFAELEARAADIQALSASLTHHERLARTAAHDLGNKLGAAQSLLDLAADSDGFQGEAAELVQQAAEQLDLSQPLLDEMRDPEREIVCEPLLVEELAKLAAAMLARRRREQDVAFALEIEPDLPLVWGERLAVLRVLDNLLSNALKHNDQRLGLRVWLRIWAEERHVVFEVGDNGVGVVPEALPQLFEFGFRIDGTGKVRGHGLGLWSSRRLVDALGGRIWAASEPGQGARFCFALPAVIDREPTDGLLLREAITPQAEPAGE